MTASSKYMGMAIDPDRFKSTIVEVLSKRAASRCSNPDCGAITSGPADDEARSINIGEAAHIYAAKPGGARFDPRMTAVERRDITNAIWLCRNCHKIVDADADGYPASLLFEWRLAHERMVAAELGKPGDRIKRKIAEERLIGFEHESYLARQIVIDKPDAWEYRLTAELLRSKLAGPLSRWRQLERGLYSKMVMSIPHGDAMLWLRSRLAEVSNIAPALDGLINEEMMRAWGAPGEPGCEKSILRTCNLFEEAALQLLAWEECVRFTVLPNEFEAVGTVLIGVAGGVLDRIAPLPSQLINALDPDAPESSRRIDITISVPEGWVDNFNDALHRATAALEY